jgi:hypothetical protein
VLDELLPYTTFESTYEPNKEFAQLDLDSSRYKNRPKVRVEDDATTATATATELQQNAPAYTLKRYVWWPKSHKLRRPSRFAGANTTCHPLQQLPTRQSI